MADIVVKRYKMFDGDTNGVLISIVEDSGKTTNIVLPRHIAIQVALEIKRASES
jgi:hypothetical protein